MVLILRSSMQKPLLISLVLSSMMLFIGCDGSSVGPILELEADEYNFGVVKTDGITEATFKIYNRGDKTLKLHEVVSSCTCTTAELLDTSIPPGGEGLMIIRINPNKMSGVGTRIPLVIKTNDPTQELVSLPVIAWREYPIQFITEMEHVSEMSIVPVISAYIVGTVDHQIISQGVPAEIMIRAAQNKNRFVDIMEMNDTSYSFDGESIDVQSSIGFAPLETWADPEIKEFDLKFTFTPNVSPGEYEIVLNLSTNIRQYTSFFLAFNFTVEKATKVISLATSEPGLLIADLIDELSIIDVSLHIVSIIKEPESTYAVRIATELSERWYNEGAEFDGYVLEKIYSVQNSIVVREIDTGRRLRVTGKDDETSTVTQMP